MFQWWKWCAEITCSDSAQVKLVSTPQETAEQDIGSLDHEIRNKLSRHNSKVSSFSVPALVSIATMLSYHTELANSRKARNIALDSAIPHFPLLEIATGRSRDGNPDGTDSVWPWLSDGRSESCVKCNPWSGRLAPDVPLPYVQLVNTYPQNDTLGHFSAGASICMSFQTHA